MKFSFTLLTLITATISFAQMRPIGKVYITEGMVLDRETSKVISSAILYNDSLGITTTSDENDYFKIVVPYQLVQDGAMIPIDVVKKGYKRNGWGIGLTPDLSDTTQRSRGETEIYGSDVQIISMAKNSSSLSSTVGATIPAREATHGAAMIRRTYDEMVSSEQRQKKFARLKQNNQKVYFPLGNATGLATRLYDLIVIGKLTHVYIDEKKVKLSDINKRVKRSAIFYDRIKSDALSKAYAKGTVTLRTTPPPGLSKERLNASFQATLEIDLGQ